jgi:2-polyprenyl-6-methoxyphenol hydroxylase-like FAD-dependent oxidoreductase
VTSVSVERIDTRCCIAGGGPAGVMLGYLLARAGIDVVVLEKWPDFFRDFRGDTIHPSTMEALHELGLLDSFLQLRHSKTRRLTGHIGGEAITLADFTRLDVHCPYVAFLPQWDFLNFLTAEAQKYSTFRVRMQTEAVDLIEEGGRVAGLHARSDGPELEIRAQLVIGADGRHSTVRERAGLEVQVLGAPIDVLWFRLSMRGTDAEQSLGYVDDGKFMVLLDRGDYWQCGFLIEKGGFEDIRARGLQAFRADVAKLVPSLCDCVEELTDWDQVKLLSVAVDRLRRWYKDGLLMIGDAAHAMSPVGGVGINLAIQDAIAASNVLVPAFERGAPTQADLAAIQKRRMAPTRMTQHLQVLVQDRVLRPVLRSSGHLTAPWPVRLFDWLPILQRVPARAIGMGFRPERVTWGDTGP